ncbi:MAG: DNA polymerase III subunit delta [Clostridia bacterium]|nr:DNA polymerase III subunit delta [Clostridia bacterium]
MQIISDSDFRKQLKSGNIGSYLFYGEEDYLKAHAISQAAEAICPDPTFAFFNITKIDAIKFSANALLDAIMQPPMMTEKKLIVLSGFDFNSQNSSELASIYDALAILSDYEYTSVIISVASGCIDEGYPSKPSQAIQRISEFITPVKFDKCTPQRLISWAERHFAHGGVKISPKALSFLIDYCGTGMYNLANEIDKLCAFVLFEGRDEVTEDDIKNVCIADVEFDTFALSNAIMEGKSSEALSVLAYLRFKRTEPLIIFGEISKTICDLLLIKRLIDDGMSCFDIGKSKIMNEYRAKILARSASKIPYERLYQKINLCTEADRMLKRSPQGFSAIEMLICAN